MLLYEIFCGQFKKINKFPTEKNKICSVLSMQALLFLYTLRNNVIPVQHKPIKKSYLFSVFA